MENFKANFPHESAQQHRYIGVDSSKDLLLTDKDLNGEGVNQYDDITHNEFDKQTGQVKNTELSNMLEMLEKISDMWGMSKKTLEISEETKCYVSFHFVLNYLYMVSPSIKDCFTRGHVKNLQN